MMESGGFGPDVNFSGKSVLVTGASGFIGVRLCRALIGQGARVHGASRNAPPIPLPGVEWHLGDLALEGVAQRVLGAVRPDIVFHLASHVDGGRSLDRIQPTLRGNLLSTVHLLSALAQDGVERVVLAGSMEEPDRQVVGPTPVSPYAAAKWAASGYARMFHSLYEVPVALARIFMVYGPGQWDERKLVPYVIRTLLSGETPKVSSGTRPVDWIFVDDVVHGLLLMGGGHGPLAVSVDLGTGTLTPVRRVVEELHAILGSETTAAFGAVSDRLKERVVKADPDATETALGWRPRVELREGLERTVAWFRAREDSP